MEDLWAEPEREVLAQTPFGWAKHATEPPHAWDTSRDTLGTQKSTALLHPPLSCTSQVIATQVLGVFTLLGGLESSFLPQGRAGISRLAA